MNHSIIEKTYTNKQTEDLIDFANERKEKERLLLCQKHEL